MPPARSSGLAVQIHAPLGDHAQAGQTSAGLPRMLPDAPVKMIVPRPKGVLPRGPQQTLHHNNRFAFHFWVALICPQRPTAALMGRAIVSLATGFSWMGQLISAAMTPSAMEIHHMAS